MGYCDLVYVSEIGDTSVTIFKQGKILIGFRTAMPRSPEPRFLSDLEVIMSTILRFLELLLNNSNHAYCSYFAVNEPDIPLHLFDLFLLGSFG